MDQKNRCEFTSGRVNKILITDSVGIGGENNLQLIFKCNHIIAISSSYRKHSKAEELSKRARRAKIDRARGEESSRMNG